LNIYVNKSVAVHGKLRADSGELNLLNTLHSAVPRMGSGAL